MFEGLEDSGIIEMLAVANQQLEDWKDLTFGIHNGSLDIEGNFDRHIGSASDASSELGKIMLDFNKNEEEMMAGLAEMETAPWDRQISESLYVKYEMDEMCRQAGFRKLPLPEY